MAKKTNKTSHVLNLITNGNSQENETLQTAETGAGNAPAAPAVSASEPSGNVPADASAAQASAAAAQASAAAAQALAAAAQVSAAANANNAANPAQTAEQNPAAQEKKVIVVNDSESSRISDEIRDQLISHLEETEKQAAAKQEMAGETAQPAEVLQEPAAESAEEVSQGAEVLQPEEVQEQPAEVSQEQPMAQGEVTAVENQVQQERQPEEIRNPAESGQAGAAAQQPESAAQSAAPAAAAQTESHTESGATRQSATDAPSAAAEEAQPQPEYRMVNVMEQILKRYNLERQMKQYDVCMCSRCKADVLALALTRLPAKYVVVDNSTVAPIIGYYETKYKVNIMTQAIKACLDVKENPRHREGEY